MDRVRTHKYCSAKGFDYREVSETATLFHGEGYGAAARPRWSLPLFACRSFAILFAIIDFAQIYFYENSLQNALREAARFATAGRVIQAYNANGSPAYETNSDGVVVPKAITGLRRDGEASRNECIRYWFLSNCVVKSIPLSEHHDHQRADAARRPGGHDHQ